MAHHPLIAKLAGEVLERLVMGAAPPLLVLGTGFAAAADMPLLTRGMRQFEDLAMLAPADREAEALRLTGSLPIPEFAQEVALLARDGFFTTLVTTNFDTLLERALDGVGLVDGIDYQIVDFVDAEANLPSDRIAVVKAYGGRLPLTNRTRGLLTGMTIVVGATATDDLADSLAYNGGELWWVGAPAPPFYQRARTTRELTGSGSDPDRFFAELSLLLQQMPSLHVAARPEEAAAKLRSFRSSGPTSGGSTVATLGVLGGATPPADDEEFERLLVRTRLNRCLETVRRLERRGGGQAIDPALDAQLEYERRTLTTLESGLAAIERPGDEVIKLVQTIRDAYADASTVKFLDTLVDQVVTEYERPQPNQDIVGASLSALSVLAHGAGVAPTLTDQLSAFAPRGFA